MIATLNSEIKVVVRVVRKTMWCPFCDRSRGATAPPYCEGCRAEFSEPAEAVVEVPAEEPEAAESSSEPRSKAK